MPFDAHYTGKLTISPPLNLAEAKALGIFLAVRHVQTVNGPLDIRRSLTPGHPDVVDWNKPAQNMPGLYTGLEITDDGASLVWNGEEKPGDLTEWIIYLIEYFLKPGAMFEEEAKQSAEDNLLHGFSFDHKVNGELHGGTSQNEFWTIHVEDNEVHKTGDIE